MARARYATNREFYLALGQRIAKARRGLLTQEDLAKKIGMTRTSVINIEKGRQQLLVHTLTDIARALGTSPEALLSSQDELMLLLKDKTKKGRDWVRTSVAPKEQD
ncbi:MAG: helix-turn-helix transcriptional regulator [Acidobacteria bacterium]|nr:helix-turn-helix transcriptional regulator [Acidobacteriota bacterium]